MTDLNLRKFPEEYIDLPESSLPKHFLVARAEDGKSFKIDIERLSEELGIVSLGGTPINFDGNQLPSVNNTGEPVSPGDWALLSAGQTYTNIEGGPPLIGPLGRWSIAVFKDPYWEIKDLGELPKPTVSDVVIEGGELAVSQDAVYQNDINRGVFDRNTGYDVIEVLKDEFNIPNSVILLSNGTVSSQAGFSAVDFKELPDDWEEIQFTHQGSTLFGFALYNSLKQSQGQFTVTNGLNTIKRTDHAVFRVSKYARMSFPDAFMDTVLFKIKTKVDISFNFPTAKVVTDKLGFRKNNIALGRNVVDFDGNILSEKGKGVNSSGATVTQAGLDASKFVNITGWESLRVTLPESTAYGFALLDSANSVVAYFPGDVYYKRIPKLLIKSDYPTAVKAKTSFNVSILDKFEFSVSFANDLQVQSERDRLDKWNVEGYDVEYLNFNTKNFPRIGALNNSNGALNPAFPLYRTTELRRLPSNWVKLLYQGYVSSTSGLNLYDSSGTHIIGIGSSSDSEVEVLRSDYINAYYYAYNWQGAFGHLYFRIFTESADFSELFTAQDTARQLTRLTNTNLKDATDLGITPERVFTKTDVAGKPYARIPTIILTNAGTTLIATEFRSLESQGDDKGQFDLILKRRVGESGAWEQTNLFPYTTLRGRAMNPSFVVDRTGAHGVTGRIYCFVATVLGDNTLAAAATTAELDLIYRYSDDDGVTWSAIASIKSAWNTTEYTGVLVSPTNGIQIQNGTLVFPTMVVKDANWRSGLFYKTPTGNWTFSPITPRPYDNESLVVELANNQVLLNCRYEIGQRLRSVYEYDFANNKFSVHETDRTFDPYHSCQMSIEKSTISGQKVYLMSYPDKSDVLNPNPNTSRFHLTVWASLDLKRWVRVYIVHFPKSLGYAVIAHYAGNTKIIYEVSGYDVNGNLIDLETSMQNLNPVYTDINIAVRVEMNRTTEEKLNEIIYQLKGWDY